MPQIKTLRRKRLQYFICAALFGILSIRLFCLQCIEGAELTELALAQSDRLVYSANARGSILDRYGNVLARSVSVPEVRLHPSEVDRKKLNQTIQYACSLLVSSGETLSCTLPLSYTSQDSLVYSTRELSDFMATLGISPEQTAASALQALREKLKIPDSFSDEDALFAASMLLAARNTQTVLVNELESDDISKLQAIGASLFSYLMLEPGSLDGRYDIVLDPDNANALDAATALNLYRALSKNFPVSCLPGSTNLPLIYDASALALAWETPEIKQLRKDLELSATATASDCLQALTKLYDIPKTMGTGDALMVAAVRLESARLGTPANHSILLAADVSEATVAAVTRLQEDMPGILIEQGWLREYPQGTLLSPVLGHIGRITAEQAQTYNQLGYNLDNDLVGR
ncbi:MAG: hypothetical protein ACOYU3_08020, partial [Bacillota bacterium]